MPSILVEKVQQKAVTADGRIKINLKYMNQRTIAWVLLVGIIMTLSVYLCSAEKVNRSIITLIEAKRSMLQKKS